MEFTAYWARLQLSNAGLSDDENKVTLTVGQLKKLMQKAHANGYDDRIAVEKACKEHGPKNPFDKLFGGMFP